MCQKHLYCMPKTFSLHANNICTAPLYFLTFWQTLSAFDTLSHLLAHFLIFWHSISYFLIFWHTFKTFKTLYRLLAHFCIFWHTLSHCLGFWYTFSSFDTLSHTFQLLAHFLILSKLLAHLFILSQLLAHFLNILYNAISW